MAENNELGEPATEYRISGEGPITVSEATKAVVDARNEASKPVEDKLPEESATPETVEPDAAPPPEAPSDATPEPDPEPQAPPVEPPRSWTKDEKEEFASYPRELQERISRREQERDTAIRRSQNEAAEKQKALDIEREQTARVRAQYEQTLPNLLNQIQAGIAGEFPDIKTWDDVEKMQADDFLRYQKWDLAQKRKQAVQRQVVEAQQQQAQDTQTRWSAFAQAEDAKFAEAAPELSDPVKAEALRKGVHKLLDDIGLQKEEVDQLWEGKSGISIRDHRVQLILRDATLWREAQAKAKTVRQAPMPQVVKPGASRNIRADAQASDVIETQKLLDKATGREALRLATKLQQLRRNNN